MVIHTWIPDFAVNVLNRLHSGLSGAGHAISRPIANTRFIEQRQEDWDLIELL